MFLDGPNFQLFFSFDLFHLDISIEVVDSAFQFALFDGNSTDLLIQLLVANITAPIPRFR